MLDNLSHPQPSQVLIDIAPAYNALFSFTSVTDASQSPGISDWALHTREKLSEDEWYTHRIITQWIGIEALGNSVKDEEALSDFSVYIQALANKDPGNLRDELLYWMVHRPGVRLNYKPLPEIEDHLSLLESREAYLTFNSHPSMSEEKLAVAEQTYDILLDPPRLRSLVVDYLHLFWEKYLKSEWQANQSLLDEAVRGFEKVNLAGLNHFEVIEAITRRNLRGVCRPEVLQSYATLRFIPSAHSGPYIMKFSDGYELRFSFGAHHLRDVAAGVDKVDRTHVVEQMKALADTTRLEIIHLLKAEQELGTQDIIDRLSLSKSAASRHLRQLYATGILDVRVDEDGLSKYYRVNSAIAGHLQSLLDDLLG